MADRGDEGLLLTDDDAVMEDANEGRAGERMSDSSAVLRQLLQQGLAREIGDIVQRQAALVFGQLADAQVASSASSMTPTVTTASLTTTATTTSPRRTTTAMDVERRSLRAGPEIISPFDPDDPDCNVSRWLTRIDQLGRIHGWTDVEKSGILQGRLTGAAASWFNRLEEYDLSWEEWKAKLQAAFPRRQDYCIMMEEMLARRKLATETMTRYYHAKLALCSRIGVTGENAVSCIVRGLPEELRASAYALNCATPEALYNKYLAGLDSYKLAHPRSEAVQGGQGARQSSASGAVKRRLGEAAVKAKPATIRCYNCQRYGTHLSRDCPEARQERCRTCGRPGHTAADCPGEGSSRAKASGEQATKTATYGQVSLVTGGLDQAYKRIGVVNGERLRVYIDRGSKYNILTLTKALEWGFKPQDTNLIMQGFAGGMGVSHGTITFRLAIDGLELDLTAETTMCDMGKIELILGQPALGVPGVALVVQRGKATLLREKDFLQAFGDLSLDEPRRLVVLAADACIPAGASAMVPVLVEGAAPGKTVYMGVKVFSTGREEVAIPSGVLKTDQQPEVLIMNMGETEIRWKAGRLIARAELCDEESAEGESTDGGQVAGVIADGRLLPKKSRR